MLIPDDYKNLDEETLNEKLHGEFQEHQAMLREWWQLRDACTDDQVKWRSRDRRLGRVILITMCLSISAWALEAARLSCALAAIVIVGVVMRLILALAVRRRVNRRMNELATMISARSGRPPAQSMFAPASTA